MWRWNSMYRKNKKSVNERWWKRFTKTEQDIKKKKRISASSITREQKVKNKEKSRAGND